MYKIFPTHNLKFKIDVSANLPNKTSFTPLIYNYIHKIHEGLLQTVSKTSLHLYIPKINVQLFYFYIKIYNILLYNISILSIKGASIDISQFHFCTSRCLLPDICSSLNWNSLNLLLLVTLLGSNSIFFISFVFVCFFVCHISNFSFWSLPFPPWFQLIYYKHPQVWTAFHTASLVLDKLLILLNSFFYSFLINMSVKLLALCHNILRFPPWHVYPKRTVEISIILCYFINSSVRLFDPSIHRCFHFFLSFFLYLFRGLRFYIGIKTRGPELLTLCFHNVVSATQVAMDLVLNCFHFLEMSSSKVSHIQLTAAG